MLWQNNTNTISRLTDQCHRKILQTQWVGMNYGIARRYVVKTLHHAIWLVMYQIGQTNLPLNWLCKSKTKKTSMEQKCWHVTGFTWKCCHFDEIFITNFTSSCQNDNCWFSWWWKFHQNYDTAISVVSILHIPLCGETERPAVWPHTGSVMPERILIGFRYHET